MHEWDQYNISSFSIFYSFALFRNPISILYEVGRYGAFIILISVVLMNRLMMMLYS
jgi:hypothetical protein